jgi:hypothetical protein
VGVVLAATLVAVSARVVRAAEGGSGVDEFRARMEKWVETSKLISQEKADWELDRETLGATRDLLLQQKEALASEIEGLEQGATAADAERRDLLLRRGEYQRTRDVLEERIRSLEGEAVAFVRELPQPLQEKLEPLLVQIPADAGSSRMPLGARLVNVLGILAQAEKFDATATLVAETRALEGDQKVQIRTLYWGLGQAVWVDAQGHAAGLGRPGAGGWEFSEQAGLSGAAERFLDLYEGNVDAIDFVEIPVEVR